MVSLQTPAFLLRFSSKPAGQAEQRRLLRYHKRMHIRGRLQTLVDRRLAGWPRFVGNTTAPARVSRERSKRTPQLLHIILCNLGPGRRAESPGRAGLCEWRSCITTMTTHECSEVRWTSTECEVRKS